MSKPFAVHHEHYPNTVFACTRPIDESVYVFQKDFQDASIIDGSKYIDMPLLLHETPICGESLKIQAISTGLPNHLGDIGVSKTTIDMFECRLIIIDYNNGKSKRVWISIAPPGASVTLSGYDREREYTHCYQTTEKAKKAEDSGILA